MMMFADIIKYVEEKEYQLAVDALTPLLKNEDEKIVAKAHHILGYINTRHDYTEKSDYQAKRHLRFNLNSNYPHPYGYVLYSQVEEDSNVALNYLEKGVARFPQDARILLEYFRLAPNKNAVIQIVKERNVNDARLLSAVIDYLVSVNQWNDVCHFAVQLENGNNLCESEQNYLDLIKAYAGLFSDSPDYSEAQRLLEKVIRTDTDNNLAYSHYLGIIYANLKLGRVLEATEFFDRIPVSNAVTDLDEWAQPLWISISFETLLSVLPRQETKMQGLGAREYRSATKGESWKFRLMNTIDECMKYAADRDAFISLMESEGYQVRWEIGRKYITYTTPDGMRCRDNKLHEEKYCKEVMEHEFRIRAEIVSARTQAAQHQAGSTSDADTTSRSVSLENRLGANDEIHGCTVVPCGSADRSVGEHQQTDVAASLTDAAGRSAEGSAASGADDRTGWEAEREFFFSAQNQTSQTASATHQYSGIDLSANGGGSTASALVGLGHRLEQLQPAAPVMPVQHHTDRKVLQKEREKKIALGHKADDHEDEQNWQQTM